MLFPHTAGLAIMWLVLVGALGLTYWEAREQELPMKLTLWWLSLVFFIHVLGYIAMRIWVAVQHRNGEGT